MVNLSKVFKGGGLFFISIILITLSEVILTPLLEALDGIISISSLDSLVWGIVVAIWVFMGCVVPIYLIIEGLKEENTNPSFMKAILGVMFFLFMIVLTVKGWFMVSVIPNTIATVSTSSTAVSLITAMYWIGFTLIWGMITIATPIMVIIKNTQK